MFESLLKNKHIAGGITAVILAGKRPESARSDANTSSLSLLSGSLQGPGIIDVIVNDWSARALKRSLPQEDGEPLSPNKVQKTEAVKSPQLFLDPQAQSHSCVDGSGPSGGLGHGNV